MRKAFICYIQNSAPFHNNFRMKKIKAPKFGAGMASQNDLSVTMDQF